LAIKKKKYHSCFLNPCLKRRGKGKGIPFVHKQEKRLKLEEVMGQAILEKRE
jgi:hypothetical protein